MHAIIFKMLGVFLMTNINLGEFNRSIESLSHITDEFYVSTGLEDLWLPRFLFAPCVMFSFGWRQRLVVSKRTILLPKHRRLWLLHASALQHIEALLAPGGLGCETL